MDKIRAKLHSCSGESISETLIAVLLSALALVMLAAMITASVNMTMQSKTKMAAYYAQNNALASPSETMIVTISSDETTGVHLSQTVNYAVNDEFSERPVIAYEVKSAESPTEP